MNWGPEFGFEPILCAVKVLVWPLDWVNLLVRCRFPPEYPCGKNTWLVYPLGSENSSRYQKSRGGTVTLALQPLTSSRIWDLNQLLRSLNLSTRDLEVKSRKKKSSDFPRLC